MPYITARNMYGNKVLVEVPEEVYSLFVGEYRFWERDNNDHRNLKQILGFTYHEIAHIQGCNKYAVQKSVKEIAKKLKNIFK